MPGISKNFAGDVFTVGLRMGDLLKNMDTLGDRLGKAVFRRGLLAGAKVIGADARARAPKPGKGKRGKRGERVRAKAPQPNRSWSRGLLFKAIVWQTRGVFRDKTGKPVGHRAVVMINKKQGRRSVRKYAHMVEFGTAPHATGKGSILRLFKRSKRKRVQVGWLHPGARPRPYMRPAFDSKKEEALKTIVDTARAEAAEEIRKFATSVPARAKQN